MNFIQVEIKCKDSQESDELSALLIGIGYEGFEETENLLLAYTSELNFSERELEDIVKDGGFEYSIKKIEPQNWNEVWESSFEPVEVDSFCTIRAEFHNIAISTPFEIVITPKMSFGTGHHATTQLMIELMSILSFKDLAVLDFGTGTGVLAILADKMGAVSIDAIDNDEWCVTNANENVLSNQCNNIIVQQKSIEDELKTDYDVILANINRQILVNSMATIFTKTKSGGKILISGFLKEDSELMKSAAINIGFKFEDEKEKGSWMALRFCKD